MAKDPVMPPLPFSGLPITNQTENSRVGERETSGQINLANGQQVQYERIQKTDSGEIEHRYKIGGTRIIVQADDFSQRVSVMNEDTSYSSFRRTDNGDTSYTVTKGSRPKKQDIDFNTFASGIGNLAGGMDAGWTGQITQQTAAPARSALLSTLTASGTADSRIPTINIKTDGTCSTVSILQAAETFCEGKTAKTPNTSRLAAPDKEYIGGKYAADAISTHPDLAKSLPKEVQDGLTAIAQAGGAFIIEHVGSADNKALLQQVAKAEKASAQRK